MPFRVSSAVVALMVGSALQMQAQTVSYAQTTFDPSQWEFVTVTATGPISVAQGLAGVGGNPGDAWVHSWSIPQLGGVTGHRVANINRLFTYDPSVHGALASLSFQFDALGFTTNGFSTPFYGFFVPTLRQGGTTFIAASKGVSPTTRWTTYSSTMTGASPWVEPNNQGGSLRPDFSATGGTMEFGYLFSINTSCPASVCAAANVVSRLDNFSVSATAATTVPEPATVSLMAAGLLAVAVTARRRRQAGC